MNRRWLIAFTWVWVGVPLGYGVYELTKRVAQLFQ